MIEEPRITELGATRTAYIHLTVAREDMPKVMGPAIGELLSTLVGQGVEVAGPVFAHHLKIGKKTFDFEVGVPVSAAVEPAGRVEAGERPVTRVARSSIGR